MTRRVALTGVLAFVTIVIVEHALAAQLAPDRHTISEYVNTRAGALMVAGFVAWATSLVATAALVWGCRAGASRPRVAMLLALLLTITSAGLWLTAAFATQTSAGVLPLGHRLTTVGRIHDLASGAAMGAMICAVIASIAGFSERRRFRSLAAAVLAISIVASVVLLCVGAPVDGIRQRVLVAAGCVWQVALVLTLSSSSEA